LGEEAAAKLGVPNQPMLSHSNLKLHVVTALRGGVDLWLHRHEVLGKLSIHMGQGNWINRWDKNISDIISAATTLYTIIKGE